MKIKLLATLSILAFVSSCAGIISGNTQTVFLRASNGSEDVKVEVQTPNGTLEETLPASIAVPRNKAPLSISVKEDECYKSSKTYAPSKYNVMLLADALGGVFGLTGTSIDMSSGAAWAYEDNVFVDVKKKSSCRK